MPRGKRRRQYAEVKREYLYCRTLGHLWEEIDWQTGVEFLHGLRIAFTCRRCTTDRVEVWSDANGELMTRKYYYPPGYSLAGIEAPKDITLREAMRLEILARRKGTRTRITIPRVAA